MRKPLITQQIDCERQKQMPFLSKKVRQQILTVGMPSKQKLEAMRRRRKSRIKRLKNLGLTVRNKNESIYLNRISPGCLDCGKKTGLTIAPTRECNRNCFFCFYPGPFKEKSKLRDRYISYIAKIHLHKSRMPSLAITGGEPLLALDITLDLLMYAKKIKRNKCQTRLYTNADMLNQKTLKKLKENKLDEIRISIKPNKNCFKKLTLAKKYISRVMVEIPVFPNEQDRMEKLLLRLNKLNIFGINLLEFVFCSRNASTYKRKGYKIMTDRVNDLSQDYPHPWDYPVYKSEETCLKLLEFAAKKNLSIGVHYCSLQNKRFGGKG